MEKLFRFSKHFRMMKILRNIRTMIKFRVSPETLDTKMFEYCRVLTSRLLQFFLEYHSVRCLTRVLQAAGRNGTISISVLFLRSSPFLIYVVLLKILRYTIDCHSVKLD